MDEAGNPLPILPPIGPHSEEAAKVFASVRGANRIPDPNEGVTVDADSVPIRTKPDTNPLDVLIVERMFLNIPVGSHITSADIAGRADVEFLIRNGTLKRLRAGPAELKGARPTYVQLMEEIEELTTSLGDCIARLQYEREERKTSEAKLHAEWQAKYDLMYDELISGTKSLMAEKQDLQKLLKTNVIGTEKEFAVSATVNTDTGKIEAVNKTEVVAESPVLSAIATASAMPPPGPKPARTGGNKLPQPNTKGA
jgi:hypothetical protein